MTNKQLFLLAGGILGASLLIYYMRKPTTPKRPPRCPAGQVRKPGQGCVPKPCPTGMVRQVGKGCVPLGDLRVEAITKNLPKDFPKELLTTNVDVKIATEQTYRDYIDKLRNQ